MTDATLPPILTLQDLGETVATSEQLSSLALSTQTAQQIVISAGSEIPTPDQLQLLPARDAETLRQLWDKNRQLNPSSLWSDFLESVVQLLTEATNHVMTLKVPYQPTGQQLAELAEIVQQHTRSQAFLEVIFQPDLVLGCVIEMSGQRIDFTNDTWLKPFVDQELATAYAA